MLFSLPDNTKGFGLLAFLALRLFQRNLLLSPKDSLFGCFAFFTKLGNKKAQRGPPLAFLGTVRLFASFIDPVEQINFQCQIYFFKKCLSFFMFQVRERRCSSFFFKKFKQIRF